MTITDNGTIATDEAENSSARPASVMRRRGLVAGAAALAAALLARQSNDPVLAADGSNLMIGRSGPIDTNNIYATTTSMTNGAAPSPLTGTVPSNAGAPTAGFRVFNSYPYGTNGTVIDATADAIEGFAAGANNSGIHGRNDTLNAIGTTGVASNGTGVYGQSTSGTAVGASTTSGNAIVAQTTSGYGVIATTSSGIGVYATSAALTGVYGQTSGAGQYGVIGVGAAASTFGLAGIAQQNNSAAFAGGTTNATCFAASFQGAVSISGPTTIVGATAITGSLVINGVGYKSGAIAHADGTHRLVYCVESPEAWITDYGRGNLVNGSAQVNFDAAFVEVMVTQSYDVYLTEYDANNGLYVTNRTANGFTVKATSGTPSGAFAWQVVLKPKGDVNTARLGKFTFPKPHNLDVKKLESSLPKPVKTTLPNRKP